MFTLTKADAIRIQTEQVSYYSANHNLPQLAAEVAAITTADQLPDGEHPVAVINRHIPRGAAIEGLVQKMIDRRLAMIG